MNKLALSVNLEQAVEETIAHLSKGKSILFIGQTENFYAKAVNMKNGSFDGYVMYAGFNNRTLKTIVKFFKKHYRGVRIESGKGWVKIFTE